MTAGSPYSNRCTHPSLQQAGAISLPVLPGDHQAAGRIRKSKNAKRRAIVLIAVQLLLIVHIVLWALSKHFGWWGGKTLTPIEPSESMEFAKNGVVNAGVIFFALALLSTLILGRWFCGWGCHVVMLQDFCGWIMKKCGVRPRLFRSRLLGYVPLLLAVYMFIMPAAYRWGMVLLDAKLAASLGSDHWLVSGLRSGSTLLGFPLPYPNMPEWQINSHFITADFWKTFASYGVAIPFLFVCGFAVVYFLGAKGFCTYGCPYGGFFSPVDRLAPGRILVTDACEGCGHCTAVCTSNVRVHEEVREYGMVVDPGCMKCLDCVSVCPNEALYFGFARPSLLKGAAKTEKPRRHYDLTLGEELMCAAVFAAAFIAWRGVYDLIPMLMAAGLAGIIAFLVWKLWRMLRDPSVTLHHFQLKFKGAIRPAGFVFASLVLGTLALTAHSGVVNVAHTLGEYYDAKVTMPQEVIFSEEPQPLDEPMSIAADRALKFYGIASSLSEGGYGFSNHWQPAIDLRRARLLSAKLDFAGAEKLVRHVISRDGANDIFCNGLMWILYAQQRSGEALDFAEPLVLERPHFDQSVESFRRLANHMEQPQRAIDVCRKRLEKFPDDLLTMRVLSMQYFFMGDLNDAVALTQRTIEIDSTNPSAYFYLAHGLKQLGRIDEAITAAEKAAQLAPQSVPIHSFAAELLASVGRDADAAVYRQKAQQLYQAQLQRMQEHH